MRDIERRSLAYRKFLMGDADRPVSVEELSPLARLAIVDVPRLLAACDRPGCPGELVKEEG